MNKQGSCYKGTCEKTCCQRAPCGDGFWNANSKISSSHSPQTHKLMGTTCTHIQSHLHWECCLKLPSLLSSSLLSSSFQFFSLLLSNASFKTLLLSSLSVSTLLFFYSLCPFAFLHLSLWSRVWVLLGEICAEKMMSHAVTPCHLPSSSCLPPPPPPSSPSSPPTLSLSPHKTDSDRLHVPQDVTRGTQTLSFHPREPLSRLTETSNHHFPKSSRHHISRHALGDVSLPCCQKLPSFFLLLNIPCFFSLQHAHALNSNGPLFPYTPPFWKLWWNMTCS